MVGVGSWLVAVALATGGAQAATPKASSVLDHDESGKHPATLAFDGLLGTSWAEGEPGDGAGTWLELPFDRPTDITSVSIWPGDLSGPDRKIRESARPRLATLSIDVGGDAPIEQEIRFDDPGEKGPIRLDVAIDAPGARSVRITTTEGHGRPLYGDLHIAEVAVNFVGGEVPKAVTDHLAWLEGEGSTKAREAHEADAQAAFDTIQAAEFGDRDSLAKLMDWAADGAPFVRERVARLPYGFRAHGVPADLTSLQLLLTEKDSNAIPAVERAAVRSRGALQADIEKRVGMFKAHQDLVGGGKRNVAPWGETGFSKGSLQSFGEPLGVGVDQYGGVWVADVGNHRVQRFQIDSGMVQEMWGGEPGMTSTWFSGQREHYASGALPGIEKGQFTNPVDLAVMPGKEGDTVVVLDAKGRVSVITPDDRVAHVVQLPVADPISGGVGGEGHIVIGKKAVIAIWGNEGFVVDPDTWEVEGEGFSLDDGVPFDAVAFKNGKVGLAYGHDLVLYTIGPDSAFRFGGILGDTLGDGFQDWAVATDQDGRLWAATDKGEIIKYKKPGKVEYRVSISEYGLPSNLRLTVFEDLVFVSGNDRILREDAYEAWLRGEAAGDGQLDLGAR